MALVFYYMFEEKSRGKVNKSDLYAFLIAVVLWNEQNFIKNAVFVLAKRGEGGFAPFKRSVVILRVRPQAAWHPKNLVLTELFLGQRGAGEVVCTAPTQLKVYEYGKSLCKNIITQWFFYYFAF